MSRIQQIEKDILRLGAHLQVASDALLVPASLNLSVAFPLQHPFGWISQCLFFCPEQVIKIKTNRH